MCDHGRGCIYLLSGAHMGAIFPCFFMGAVFSNSAPRRQAARALHVCLLPSLLMVVMKRAGGCVRVAVGAVGLCILCEGRRHGLHWLSWLSHRSAATGIRTHTCGMAASICSQLISSVRFG